MPTAWPVEEFAAYLRALMDAVKIADYAELSRRTGVSQTQLSHWRRGNAKPSRDSLRKLAPVLRVPPVNLYLAAGVHEADELDLTTVPDFRVLPIEFRDLAELWDEDWLNDGHRLFIRRSVANLVAGVRAEKPASRRTTGRRRAG